MVKLRDELLQPQPKYSFNPNLEDSTQITRDVDFIMTLVDANERHTDPNVVRERINGLSDNVQFTVYLNSSAALVAKTDKATYERLFQTSLEYDQNNARTNGYTMQGYREPVRGQPIAELADIVLEARLNYVRK